MKIFDEFKYILVGVIIVQIFSISILMYLGHYQYESVLEIHTKHEKARANEIYKNVFAEASRMYSMMGENILTPEVIETFLQKDRDKLYKLMLPKFKELQNVNKYVNNIHFHTKELFSFLRVNRPKEFGDDLSLFRPMLVKESQQREKLSGLEMGKNGLFHRTVLPIYKDEEFIGSVELGIDIKFFAKRLEQFTQLTPFIFIKKDQTQLMHRYASTKANNYYVGSDDTYELLQYLTDEKAQKLLKIIDKKVIEDYKIVTEDGEVYLLFNGLKLKNFAKEEIGSVIFIQKLDYYFKAVTFIRWVSITTTLLLLLLSVYLIIRLIKRHTRNLLKREVQLRELANTDQLTKLYNRHSFTELFSSELKKNMRNKIPMSFLLVDIDNFKLYNDNYGHPQGDEVLKSVAQTMKEMLKRPGDYVFRIGGEEFVIIYNGLSYEESLSYTQSVIKRVEELNIEHQYNQPYNHITVSIGVCHVSEYKNVNEENIYKEADKALYEAKKIGKNMLVGKKIS